MSDIPDHVLTNIAAAMDEMNRLQALSNEQLVREYLLLGEDVDDEPYTDEMMSRLYPAWAETEL